MHDPTHEYDDNCWGCQPAIIDRKTGKLLPEDHPDVLAIMRVWREETTLEERRAWHRVVIQFSKNEKDMKIAQRIAGKMHKALENDNDSDSKNN